MYGRHGGYPRGNTGTGSRCSLNVSCDSWAAGWAVRGFRAAAEGGGGLVEQGHFQSIVRRRRTNARIKRKAPREGGEVATFLLCQAFG